VFSTTSSGNEPAATPVFGSGYWTRAPAARFATDECERLGRAGEPVLLVTPPGVDPVPWGALVHGASAGESGPLVVVDGTASVEHDEARWQDAEKSPLALADGSFAVSAQDAHGVAVVFG